LDCAHRFHACLVCTLVFLDCAQVFPDIPRLVEGFPRYSETCLRGFFGLCTPSSSVHSHISSVHASFSGLCTGFSRCARVLL